MKQVSWPRFSYFHPLVILIFFSLSLSSVIWLFSMSQELPWYVSVFTSLISLFMSIASFMVRQEHTSFPNYLIHLYCASLLTCFPAGFNHAVDYGSPSAAWTESWYLFLFLMSCDCRLWVFVPPESTYSKPASIDHRNLVLSCAPCRKFSTSDVLASVRDKIKFFTYILPSVREEISNLGCHLFAVFRFQDIRNRSYLHNTTLPTVPVGLYLVFFLDQFRDLFLSLLVNQFCDIWTAHAFDKQSKLLLRTFQNVVVVYSSKKRTRFCHATAMALPNKLDLVHCGQLILFSSVSNQNAKYLFINLRIKY